MQEKNSTVGMEGLARRFVKFGGAVGEEQLAWLRGQLQVGCGCELGADTSGAQVGAQVQAGVRLWVGRSCRQSARGALSCRVLCCRAPPPPPPPRLVLVRQERI